MGKTKQSASEQAPTSSAPLAAKDSLDPTLASLFASSSGPIKIPARVAQVPKRTASEQQLSSGDEASSAADDSDAESESEVDTTARVASERPRKRRRVADGDDLEASYFKRLEQEEEKEHQRSAVKEKATGAPSGSGDNDDDNDEKDGGLTSDSDETSASQSDAGDVPRHEVFDKKINNEERLKRTVFLGNVSTEAIKSTSAKKTLTRHLRSALKTSDPGKRLGKLESLRFRSTAYASGSGPKKATFAKKELMDETTTNTNAYAVFSTEAAAAHVAATLNGSVVLERHLRADYLGKPAKTDHRRCIFIGNLSFVNKETAGEDEEDADDSKKRRASAKEPADPEEGLWRTFSKIGKIESVRVVRDQETRVSKGFAYVQFENENSVEGALLMNDKKFPPLLPRKLRVMRARRIQHKTTPARSDSRPGTKGPLGKGRAGSGGKPGFVFEGHRASSTSKGNAGSLKKRHKKRPTTRSSRRGAAYKAAGGRKGKDAGGS
ncbi:hypothetical protein A1O1_05315 [Capronia coronata CBS 617.96]|uniref:Nucleolar protein 12 n=1 Tax=Capronia coronata CBS 617.96 TaxID=1182541 RepID=W9YFG3_9EURO|nr:uncharacterized protein A1O1_05315 [Capronia coronata CBS 617.96]EXJ88385.1 hypothetical protein A1O1_05315 [Capronia coronata CBS 617.96]